MTPTEQAIAALRAAVDALDAMGDESDIKVSPTVWKRLNCEDKIAAAREALAALRAASEPVAAPAAPATEKELRCILCAAYAGGHAYTDDGEAQDNRVWPFIDFLRDTPEVIQTKMQERGRAMAAAAPQAEPSDEQIDRMIERHLGGTEVSDEDYASMVVFSRAVLALRGAKS